MKKIILFVVFMLPIVAHAQNTWERHTESPAATRMDQTPSSKEVDPKYLVGAVPLTDGRVTFTTTLAAPAKTAQEIYDIIGYELSTMAHEEGQYESSRILLADTASHRIVGNFQERMVFKSSALSFDYTRFSYHLVAECSNGQAVLKMTRISYLYEEARNAQTYLAEEWITDKYGLNKNGDKLARISGKFRKKTIDRKDEIFERLAEKINQ